MEQEPQKAKTEEEMLGYLFNPNKAKTEAEHFAGRYIKKLIQTIEITARMDTGNLYICVNCGHTITIHNDDCLEMGIAECGICGIKGMRKAPSFNK